MVGGSGDKMYDWSLAFSLLLSAALLDCLVVDRSAPPALRPHASRISDLFAVCARLDADRLRRSQGGSAADAISAAYPAPRAVWQLLADGRALVLNRCVSAVRNLHRQRGALTASSPIECATDDVDRSSLEPSWFCTAAERASPCIAKAPPEPMSIHRCQDSSAAIIAHTARRCRSAETAFRNTNDDDW